MTAVRIAHAEPRPGNLGNGVFITNGYLVVLADDAGHRALPVWFRGEPGGGELAKLTGRETDDIAPAGAPEELTGRLLYAAGASVTGVDIDAAEAEADGLGPGAYTARIELADPDNTIVAIGGDRDWASHEVTARIPGDCDIVAFGVFLAGPGRIELRHAELIRAT